MANCPINEQTGDGICFGRCWHHLEGGLWCPRHGDVAEELKRYEVTGRLTIENDLRRRQGRSLLGSQA